ncbi:hypothetical protein CLU79DRAFT_748949 [Phycomyces nitens]|nr:hypothetical protein CLU79DRAFT_748949 [Phycomyces nitens]
MLILYILLVILVLDTYIHTYIHIYIYIFVYITHLLLYTFQTTKSNGQRMMGFMLENSAELQIQMSLGTLG